MTIDIHSPESIAVHDVHPWQVMFIDCNWQKLFFNVYSIHYPLQYISVYVHHHLSCSTTCIDSSSPVFIAEAIDYYCVYYPECAANREDSLE